MDVTEQFAHIATGAVYDDLTPELVAVRAEAVRATNAYNAASGQPAPVREPRPRLEGPESDRFAACDRTRLGMR